MGSKSQTQLVADIEAGKAALCDISTSDFRALMSNPETKEYGLMICAQSYYLKATESLNHHMDCIALSDDINRQMLRETNDIVRRDNHGKIYINASACSVRFGKYFASSFQSMWDIAEEKPNVIGMVQNFFNLRKNIKETNLYLNISKEVDRIKEKYITIGVDTKYNIPLKIKEGWREFRDCVESGEFSEYLDDYDNVEEGFELVVETIGCVEPLLNDFENDLYKLKDLMKQRKKFQN